MSVQKFPTRLSVVIAMALTNVSLSIYASDGVFEEVIVVTGKRLPVFSNLTDMADQPIPVTDIAALVGQMPGAALINNGGLSGQVAYRGVFGSRIGTTLNGQRFESGGPNMMDPPLHYAPPVLVEKIEVSRGTPGLEFGPALVGGVNAVLKQVPFQATSKVEGHYDLTASGRGNNGSQAVGGIAGMANDRYRGHMLFSDEHGQNTEFPAGTIASSAFDRQVYGLAGGMQSGSSTYDVEFRHHATGPTGNPPFGMDIEYVDADFARLGWASNFGDINVTASAGYADIAHGMNNYALRPAPANPALYRRTLTDATTWVGSVKIDMPTAAGLFKAGLDTQLADKSASIGNPNSPGFVLQSLPAIVLKRTGMYLQIQPSLNDWRFLLGVRVDGHNAEAGRASTGPAVPAMPASLALAFNGASRQWQATTVDALARVWRVQGDANWRLSLSRRNRAPDYVERFAWLPTAASAGLADGNTYVGNQNLNYETATTLDAGVDLLWGNGYVRPTVYITGISNYIQGIPFDTTPGIIDSVVEQVSNMNGDSTPLQFNNVDARLYGFDMDFGYQLNRSLGLNGSLTVNRGERRDIDDQLYRLAPPRLMLGMNYQRRSWGINFKSTYHHRQSRVSESNSEIPTSGYTLFDLSSHWQPTPDLTLLAGIENLFDSQYSEHLGGYNRVAAGDVGLGERLPGSGRSLFLSVQVTR